MGLRRRFCSPVLALILITVFFVVLRSTWEVYKKDRMARINREESEERLNNLVTRKEYLVNQLKVLGTDRGIEAELRSKYQITKDGESELVLVDVASATDRGNLPENFDGKSFWDDFVEYIKF